MIRMAGVALSAIVWLVDFHPIELTSVGLTQDRPPKVHNQWIDLFNGKDLSGWSQRGGDAEFFVADGAIVGTAVPDAPNSFLCTDRAFGDFELELDFLVDSELNSGIQIRSECKADDQGGTVFGYQVEIDPTDRAWTGGLYDESRRGWLDDLSDNRAARYAFRQGEWNHLRIIAIGDHIQTWLNRVAAADFHDSLTARGFIALQVHGIGSRKEKLSVRWKNIRLREPSQIDPATFDSLSHDPGEIERPIFAVGTMAKLLADGFEFTEGPAVGPDGRIYFNDIPKATTHVYDPRTQETTVFRNDSGKANGLYWTPNDALISCQGESRSLTRRWRGTERTLASSFGGKRLNSPNDLVLDGSGGIYFTDPRYGDRSDLELDVEGVYYLPQNGELRRVIEDLVRPNGIILSPDEKILYVADEAAATIWAWDLAGGGELLHKRKFANFGSDGMTIDTAGNLYLTWDGSIIVLAPSGREIARLRMPESPANCTLVDSTLYVTARTGFYSVPTNSRGLLSHTPASAPIHGN